MDGLSLGLAVFSLIGAGALAWALGKLSQPIGTVKPADQSAIDVLMSGGVAAYTYPKKREEPPLSDEAQMTGQAEVDIRIELAKQGQKVESLTTTVEREFSRMAEALGKHADAVNQAFNAMRGEFVTKSDFRALEDKYADLKKIVWGACGLILTSVFVAIVATVLVKP